MNNIDAKIQSILPQLEKRYQQLTPTSRELYMRAMKKLPAGVTYSIRYFSPYPIYVAKARGTKVWDVDGNEYIDFWMGHGTHLLGHLHETVVKSIEETLDVGTHLGFEHPYAVEYAEFLGRVIPSIDRVRFTNSGTEANMYAIRLARAFTKRNYIVKIEGGWHGAVNNLHVAVTYPYAQRESAGYVEDYQKYTIAVPFNDLDTLEDKLRKYDVAAVIMEPVMGAAGCIEPDPGFLKEVRRVTYETGTLLIFDEVVTGFRLAPGGAQEYYGVNADITVLGKSIGGGVGSIGAFGGRDDIMDLLDHLKHPLSSERVAHGGTFVANTLVVRTGYAVTRYLYENRVLYEMANSKWASLRRKITDTCMEHGINCFTTGEGTLTGIHFTTRRPRNARDVYEYRWSRVVERALNLYMRVNGFLFVGEKNIHLLPSLVHSDEELNQFLNVFTSFLEIIKQ